MRSKFSFNSGLAALLFAVSIAAVTCGGAPAATPGPKPAPTPPVRSEFAAAMDQAVPLHFDPGNDNDVEPGVGYDSIAGTTVGICITFDTPKHHLDASGQLTEQYLRRVQSASELESSLSLNGTATFGIGLFDSSLSLKYLQNTHASQYSLTVVEHALFENDARYIPPASIRLIDVGKPDDPQHLASAGRWADFRRKCGDYFVDTISSGGAIDLVFETETADASVRQRLDAAFSASYGPTASLKGDASQALASSISSAQTTVQLVRKGPHDDAIDISDIAKLQAYIVTMPQRVRDPSNAWTVKATLKSYAPFLPISAPNVAGAFYQRAMDQMIALYQLQASWNFVRSELVKPGLYPAFLQGDLPSVDQNRKAVSDAISSLNSAAQSCSAIPTQLLLQGMTCEAPIASKIPSPPPPANWVTLSGNQAGQQLVGTTTGDLTPHYLRVTGSWSIGAGWPYTALTEQGNQQALVIIHDNISGNDQQKAASADMILPPSATVYVQLRDPSGVDSFYDDAGNPSDPPRAAIYVPVSDTVLSASLRAALPAYTATARQKFKKPKP